jgi:uncharacterized protein
MSRSGTALITGASAGIGAAYADRLARRGCNLILVARDEARLIAVAERIRSGTGRRVEVMRGDLTRREDLLAVEGRLATDATISVLVNNAGVAAAGPLLDNGADHLQMMVELNVIAPLRLARALAGNFVDRRSDTIINVASVLALAPERFNGTYSGIKAFLLNLSRSLDCELKDKGVRVQAVLPGATRTEIWGKAGVDVASFPAEVLMDVDEMVDGALSGLDLGEAVTIPSLPDTADWRRYEEARLALGPNLSRNHAARRYVTS